MTTRGGISAAVLLMLTACVPSIVREPTTAPRIEPVLEGLLDELPIWDSRPVQPAAETFDGQRYHRVKVGDTGIAVARAYGIGWQTIITANGLIEPFILHIGQRLRLPDGGVPNAKARAAAFKIDINDIATGGTPARSYSGIASETSSKKFAGKFRWPLSGIIADRFGPVGRGRVNRGIEILGPPGGEISAAADGSIAFVGNGGSAGYGGLILIQHGNGWISVYGRAAQALVVTGQHVKAGQNIGSISNEGRLHFELRRNRVAVDPTAHLPPR